MHPDCLLEYLDCFVKIIISNGHYFKGKIIDVKKDTIILIDINSRRVSLAASNIIQIEEVANGN